jgi:hypothetical protein
MADHMCPGQDTRYWKPEDLFDTPCVHCGNMVEFFKDDAMRDCPFCGKLTLNPKQDLTCGSWCKHTEECETARNGVKQDLVEITHA